MFLRVVMHLIGNQQADSLNLHDIWTSFGNIYGQWRSLAVVLVILAVTAAVTLIVHLLLRKRYQRAGTHNHIWREALIGALNAPLQALLWIVGITLAVGTLSDNGNLSVLAEYFPSARNIASVIVAAWFLVRVERRVEKNLYTRARILKTELDETAADAIGKLARAVIIVAAVLTTMQSLGFSIAGLLAFGGAAGIALGFAAQTLVANLLGGLTVYASRIFKIGDDIIFPGTKLAGTVQKIGWRATRVLGWDGKPFYVPNSLFNSSNVVNHSRLVHRTIEEHLLLRYRNYDKVRAIVCDANEFLKSRKDLNYFVFRFDKFGEGALKLLVYAWAQTVPGGSFLPYAEYMRIKEEIMLEIADIALRHGCELVFPVANVYAPEGLPLQAGKTGYVSDPRARKFVEHAEQRVPD